MLDNEAYEPHCLALPRATTTAEPRPPLGGNQDQDQDQQAQQDRRGIARRLHSTDSAPNEILIREVPWIGTRSTKI